MDKAAKRAIDNAQIIIKSFLDLAKPVSKISALSSLDGLTINQKIRIETAIKLINMSREELLRATYPNDDLFGKAK